MKVIFIGLGSIGQRHLQNLIQLKIPDTSIMAFRSSSLNRIIKNGKIIANESFEDYYNVEEYSDMERALEKKPDIAFICNPSSLHLDTAIKIAKRSINFFVEKPLCVNLSSIGKLEGLIEKNDLITMVGYQMRFHPGIIRVKKIISEKKYGDVISANFKWGTFLPHHHPYENYSEGYAAKKELGGGAIFSLIHEMDLIQWFFGLPSEVYAIKGAQSKLQMDVEDNIIAQFKYNYDGLYSVPVSLNLSLSQGLEERYFMILMQDGIIKCDLRKNTLIVADHDGQGEIFREYNNLKRNDLFLQELGHYIDSVNKRKSSKIPVSEGKKSVLMALATHESINTNEIVTIYDSVL